jgi:plastocyanin
MSVVMKAGVIARWAMLGLLLGAPLIPLVPMMAWSDEGTQVGIDNFKFNPNPLTVEKGTEVTWTNHDDIPHSIVLNSISVRSKAMDTDGTFTYKFDKAGTYFYVCGLHPFMQSKVIVK